MAPVRSILQYCCKRSKKAVSRRRSVQTRDYSKTTRHACCPTVGSSRCATTRKTANIFHEAPGRVQRLARFGVSHRMKGEGAQAELLFIKCKKDTGTQIISLNYATRRQLVLIGRRPLRGRRQRDSPRVQMPTKEPSNLRASSSEQWSHIF